MLLRLLLAIPIVLMPNLLYLPLDTGIPAINLANLLLIAMVMALLLTPRDRLTAHTTGTLTPPLLFLFGGAFYPIGQLPEWLQALAKITPLWHGVELCRGSVHATLSALDVVVHCAVLVAYALAGTLLARRAFATRLAK